MEDAVYSSLNPFTLSVQHAEESFASQSTDSGIAVGTGKWTLKGQWLLLQVSSLVPHENFIKEMFCLDSIDEEIKHP